MNRISRLLKQIIDFFENSQKKSHKDLQQQYEKDLQDWRYSTLAKRHEDYVQTRADYVKGLRETQGRFDQWMMALPSGALALSITFLDKIALNSDADEYFFLLLGWGGCIFALILGFVSLAFCCASYDKGIDIVDARWKTFKTTFSPTNPEGDSIPPNLTSNKWNLWVNVLKITSLIFTVAAIVGLAGFAIKNVERKFNFVQTVAPYQPIPAPPVIVAPAGNPAVNPLNNLQQKSSPSSSQTPKEK